MESGSHALGSMPASVTRQNLSAFVAFRQRYLRASLRGAGVGCLYPFMMLLVAGSLGLTPHFLQFDDGTPGWIWPAYTPFGVGIDLVLVGSTIAFVVRQVQVETRHQLGVGALPGLLAVALTPFALALISGDFSMLWIGITISGAAAVMVTLDSCKRSYLEHIDDPCRFSTHRTLLALKRTDVAALAIVFTLISAYGVLHPFTPSTSWFGGAKPQNVRVGGEAMPQASFISHLTSNGALPAEITQIRPLGVDPRLVFVNSVIANSDDDDGVPITSRSPMTAGRFGTAAFFVVFGVRGCDDRNAEQSARTTKPFQQLEVTYSVAGQERKMLFAGATSHSARGFNLCSKGKR